VQRERGLALIIAYKLGKGGLWFLIAAVLLVLMRLGLEDRLLGVAEHLRLHARIWSLKLAELVVRAASPRGIETVIVALVADGAFSLVEGWALLRGHAWGKWLVVISTGAFLPFEAYAFARHRHFVRALLFVLNLAIVVYLARKVLAEVRQGARAPAGDAPGSPGGAQKGDSMVQGAREGAPRS
jgi:uncharacterized membrane protein (DUF2068 family)